MTQTIADALLHLAEKPSRYIGTEVSAARKSAADLRFLLAFPDTYEVGMSHLGLQILYAVLNAREGVWAERSFAPWPDREALLRERGLPLTSLESGSPLSQFDLVGFSLQYELSYTNVLNMLDLGGVAIRSADRRETDPLILAGGPCAFNPAPLSAFIDAFVIGEGEQAILEIAESVIECKKQTLSRRAALEKLARIPGVYVPSLHVPGNVISRRAPVNLNDWPHPVSPVVPLMQTVHDRIVIELARGCTRGCRFCQAGMLWRPYRERNASQVLEMAKQTLGNTGHDEISLLALSAGDYSCIEPLMQALMQKHSAEKVALALPSLRVETLGQALIEEIKRTRKTSFTLAPEAGTDKMRRIINKGNTAQDLLTSIDKVFASGWKAVKLYFMIGLPGEDESDLAGIVDLSYAALGAAKRRGQITVSLSTFVPKPHTPFQWAGQLSLDQTKERQNFLRQKMHNRNLNVKWHDARMSLLEGLFSRGDEHIGHLLEIAWRKGCRFDGWGELLRFDLWESAIGEAGISVDDYLRERSTTEPLPWDFIDCGVSCEFLIAEKHKAIEQQTTADCRFDVCQACGVCDFKEIQNIFSDKDFGTPHQAPVAPAQMAPLREKVYRLSFAKTGRSRFLSHLELASALTRALRRSPLQLSYSEGFHPHPKISFATATSVGMESFSELLDITAREFPGDLAVLQKNINAALPEGVYVTAIALLPYTAPDLARALKGFCYDLVLPADTDDSRLQRLDHSLRAFLAADTYVITRMAKGKSVKRDIRPFVKSLTLSTPEKKVIAEVSHAQNGSVRPVDIIEHIMGFPADAIHLVTIVKTHTLLI